MSIKYKVQYINLNGCWTTYNSPSDIDRAIWFMKFISSHYKTRARIIIETVVCEHSYDAVVAKSGDS